MSKPELEVHLDWVDLYRWFEKTYPKEFKHQKVRDWLVGYDGVSNGSLITASGECLSPEFDEGEYEATDWKAVKFFMQTLHDEFPKAVDQYGDVKIHFWW